MAYYLRHYFDPDFNHTQLAPHFMNDGGVNQYYLGYVQNVVAGQVLAELINLDEHPDMDNCDPRFVYDKRVFPCGPNCAPHCDNPSRIIATANGYCFYNDGLITVKKLLNIRRNVDFHTGNVMFTGDIVAHGMVRTGFSLKSNNILIKDIVEGAIIKAEGDIVCESGVKGADTGFLKSGGNIKLPFCENVRLFARGNIEIEGSCMHSEIYVGGSLMIKGRLQGGTIHANNIVYVKEQIGGGQSSTTKILMGYDPLRFYDLKKIDHRIAVLYKKIERYNLLLQNSPELADEISQMLELAQKQLEIQQKKRNTLWQVFSENIEKASKCRIMCPGKIRPGLEIAIGEAYRITEELYENQEFSLHNFDVINKTLR